MNSIRKLALPILFSSMFLADSCSMIVKIEKCGFSFFFIFFLILFFFQFISHFSIFRTLGLGLKVICHTVTPVTSDGVVTTLIIKLERKE